MSEQNLEKDKIKEEIKNSTYEVGTLGESIEEENEDIYDGTLLINQRYETPKDEDKFIDVNKGEIIEKSKLSPFEVIKAVAKQNNIEIRNPRSGCKHCYGRGFIGQDYKTKQPIPCSCIYPVKTNSNVSQTNVPRFTKKQFKMLKKLIKAEKKLLRLQKLKEEERLRKIEEQHFNNVSADLSGSST